MKYDDATDAKSAFSDWDTVTITRTNPFPDTDNPDAISASDIPSDQRHAVEATRVVYSDDLNIGRSRFDLAPLTINDRLPNVDIDLSFELIETPHEADAIRLTATTATTFTRGDPLDADEQRIHDLYTVRSHTVNIYDDNSAARLAITFQTWSAINDASDAELNDVKGIGEKTIERIRNYIDEHEPHRTDEHKEDEDAPDSLSLTTN